MTTPTTETPRSDKFDAESWPSGTEEYTTRDINKAVDFARQLETELTSALAEVERLRGELAKSREGWRERLSFAMDGPHGDPDECPTWYDGCNCGIVMRLQAQVAGMRDALAVYADDKSWRINSFTDGNSSNFDGWGPAREALTKFEAITQGESKPTEQQLLEHHNL